MSEQQQERQEQPLTTADIASASNAETAPAQESEGRGAPSNQPSGPGASSGASATQQQAQKEQTLFSPQEERSFRSRWNDIQRGFVDNPQQTVQEADHLVAEVIKSLADTFAKQRSQLEQQWSQGQNVSTEDLRVALQHYRSFFDRLLSL